MLNEKEKSELKKKNLELINEWVKEYCEDDFRCMSNMHSDTMERTIASVLQKKASA